MTMEVSMNFLKDIEEAIDWCVSAVADCVDTFEKANMNCVFAKTGYQKAKAVSEKLQVMRNDKSQMQKLYVVGQRTRKR